MQGGGADFGVAEHMVGVALFMDSGRMQNRAAVISAGYAYRLLGQTFVQEFNQKASMFNLMLHYTQALITQMAQTAACNRYPPFLGRS